MMKILNNQWYVAAASQDIAKGTLLGRRICNMDVVIYRGESGQVGVLEDRCAHRMAPLSTGDVIGDNIQCPYHGAQFDARGDCKFIPCQPATRPEGLAYFKGISYPVVERFGFIFMWVGDADKADEALLPNWGQYTAEGWESVHGYHYVEGNYMLLIDNLNDLSHLSYVHRNTLGKIAGNAWTENPVEVITTPDTVSTARVMHNVPPSLFSRTVRKLSPDRVDDRFQTSEFSAPSFVAVALGSDPAEQGLKAMSAPTHVVLNAVTPLDETRSHYFWSVERHEALGDAEVSKILYDVTVIAFDEDKHMIESQQRRISSAPPGRELKAFRIDGAVVATRRLMEKKLQAQESQS